MQVLPISGNTQRLDGGAMYGNAPRVMWEAWSTPDERHRIPLACRAMLVLTDDGRKILFETGIGAFFEPKLRERYGVLEEEHVLLENLARSGVPHTDIDAVVLSHLHFDHAGGLLSAHGDGEPRLLFPNATFYVGALHWKRANAPHQRDRASFIPELHALLSQSGRMVLVHEGETPLGPLVRFHFSHGHTVGLMLAEVQLASGPVVFASDLIPGIPWVHIPLSMGYDRFPELLIEEKETLLSSLLQRQGKLFFTHDPMHPCGRVLRGDRGRFYAEPARCEALSAQV